VPPEGRFSFAITLSSAGKVGVVTDLMTVVPPVVAAVVIAGFAGVVVRRLLGAKRDG
jgi:hypothetical protein